MKTSEIEGEFLDRDSVQSSVSRQFGLTADRRSGSAETGIARLMVACFQGYKVPLTDSMLFNWHGLVCAGRTDLKMIGAYRDHDDPMQVVSGSIQKPKVHFEVPKSSVMQREVIDFLNWFATSELPALTKAGLAHLYFVSIHPFEDGNGRIARALSEKALSQALDQPSLLALSRLIRADRSAYYDALEANNKTMGVTGWLLWFAKIVLKAQNYSTAMIDHLIAKTRMLDRLRGQLNVHQEKALIRMYDAGSGGFMGGLVRRII